MKSKQLIFIFLPALFLSAFGLLVQVIRYEPLYPKEAKKTDPKEELTIPIYDDDPILGEKSAPITLIVFEDLLCESCQEQMKLIETLLQRYPKKVKIIWKGLPVTRFPESSELAHQYAYCANEQKKFPEFSRTLIAEGTLSQQPALQSLAHTIDLNAKELGSCLSSGRPINYQEKIEALASWLNIQAVPAVFLNNTQIEPPSDLQGWITMLNLSPQNL